MQIRSRIAPTPSGFLHLGNVFSFLLTWLIVREKKGYLLLRIDDLDAQRRRVAYIDDIFSTLEWLGIDYDEGASGTTDFLQNFSQEKRINEYENLLSQLAKNQAIVFECPCSRAELQQRGGICIGNCNRLLTNNLAFERQEKETAWRVEVPTSPIAFRDIAKGSVHISLAESMGNFIIRRKDGIPSYQMASLSDDLKYGINLVVRGEDLIDSTAAQVFLAQILEKQEFTNAQFLHHALLYENENRKMSKSHDALSVKALRATMASPKPIFQWAARQFGFPQNIHSLQDLFYEFAIRKQDYSNNSLILKPFIA